MNDSEEPLARVTYLPGVVPPSSESFPSSDPTEIVAAPRGAGGASPERRADLVAATRQILDRPVDDLPETAGERSARAHNVSMHALTRRGVSSGEMLALLLSREIESADAELEIASLERVGLLDDVELARTLVRTLTDRKGLGRSAITSELRRRKIPAEAIEIALSENDGDDELERATELAVKRAPQLRSLDADTAKRRLGAFLMRKGYSGSVVSAAVSAALTSSSTGLSRSGRTPTFR